MDESLRAQIDAYLPHLDSLIRRGRQLRGVRAADGSDRPAPLAIHSADLAETRIWQRDCATVINQLSGGSKAHWLSRAFSDAFLVKGDRRPRVDADVTEIIDRICDVLQQAARSLSGMDGDAAVSVEPPPPRRFGFVHNALLRPVLEETYLDSRRALEQGDFGPALVAACSILEALITDALEHEGEVGLANDSGTIAAWTFDARIAAAQRAGLIRGGCARLPAVARRYRDLTDGDGELLRAATISERDARLASEVLHVVMRDLDPGR